MKRLVNQVKLALDAGATRIIVATGDKFSPDHMKRVLKHFEKKGIKTAGVQMISGLVEFGTWLNDVAGGYCF